MTPEQQAVLESAGHDVELLPVLPDARGGPTPLAPPTGSPAGRSRHNFCPTVAEFRDHVVDTAAGPMEFRVAAVDLGLT